LRSVYLQFQRRFYQRSGQQVCKTICYSVTKQKRHLKTTFLEHAGCGEYEAVHEAYN
jgi:hypothetical protein